MAKKSLNLSEGYVPNWNKWEVVREMTCNFIDAGEHTISYNGEDEMILFSPTNPSFSELTVIGASGSRQSDEKIGQFGEGFKLATLVTHRLGGSVEVLTEEGKMTFSLDPVEGLSERVLHANISRRMKRPGCKVTVRLPGIKSEAKGRFVPQEITNSWLSTKGDTKKIFCKRVFIAEIYGEALYSWNLDLELNRDRAMIDWYAVENKVAQLFAKGKVHPDLYQELLNAPKSFECRSLRRLCNWEVTDGGQYLMQCAWKNTFHERAVLASKVNVRNQIALAKDYDVKFLPDALAYFGIKTADDVTSISDEFEEVQPPQKIAALCAKVMEILGVDALVGFYADYEEAPLGKAFMNADIPEIWINIKMLERSRVELFSVIAHELAHIDSSGGDGSIAFECKLDQMVGLLLDMVVP